MSNTSRTPLASVIIPSYNAGHRLARAVASVRSQSETDWEMIIVEDASRDDTHVIATSLAATDPRIRLISLNRNVGAGRARSAGMEAAKGRYVAFLDADDCWHPRKLERQIAWMREHDWRLSCTAYARRCETGGDCVFWGVPEKITRRRLLGTNVMGFSTVMYDREALGQRQMPAIRRRQDFMFLLDILSELSAAGGLNIPLTLYNRGKGTLSSRKLTAARSNWELYRRHLDMPLGQAAWYFTQYALQGAMRHHLPGPARRLGVLSPVTAPEQSSFHDWLADDLGIQAHAPVPAPVAVHDGMLTPQPVG